MANIDGVNPPVLNDTDYVSKIETSFIAIDNHDHTTGKGLPISGAAVADGSITNAKLEVVIGDANKFLTRDVTGAVESSTKAVPTGVVVGTTDSQTLTNKVLTGNTIANFENSGTVTVPTGASTLVTTTGSQTLTNKTLTSPLMTDPEVTAGGLTVPEISTPTTPASGKGIIYFKSDGFPYAKNDAGTEILMSSSGAAGDESSMISNLGLSASVAANALTINLTDKSGATPSGGSQVSVGFRNATLATGQYSVVSTSSAVSMTVSSGSTLGHASGIDRYIYVYLLNNAGTVELAVSSVFFEDGTTHSTTAEGGAGAADSNSLLYSTTARSNVATRLVGRLKVNEATAGTWATAPSEISLTPFTVDKIFAKYRKNDGAGFGVVSVIDFNSKVEDNYNAVTTGGSWVFTAPMAGTYRISATLLTDAIANNIFLYKNAAQVEYFSLGLNRVATYYYLGSSQITLAAGDTISLVSELSAGTTNVSGDFNYICIESI
jgi:hypothetical protein